MAERAAWRRVTPAAGQVLDALHARIVEPFAPHLHEEFAVGACTEGVEVIRYRGARHYSGPGSVAVLQAGEPHTGEPLDRSGFVYRVMYPASDLLREASGQVPWFPEPVVTDPELADGLRRVHVALGRNTDPFELESGLAWLLGELVRRHGAGSVADVGPRTASAATRLVMATLSDRLACPPALAEMAAQAGMSRYQLVRAFAAEVGMPPYAWLAQHRVARARGLLEQGRGLAETAALTGFADQAHLTRWFRRVVGVTPGVYRNSVQDTTKPPESSFPGR
ncbi:MAG TPA: AraC family transcriptional regulator [Trebonia sp.]|nr:AraC family transcriptional regulator [Trebonia sp.]